jgi:hypothetical protein
MAALGRADIVDLLKELWPEGLADEAVVKDHPTLGMIRRDKNPQVFGRYIHLPIQYGKSGGRSRLFGTAQANQNASKYDAFDVTIVSDYCVGKLTGLAVDLAKQGTVANLINELENETKGALATLGDQLGMDVFRNFGGARGQFSSVISGTPPAASVYALVNPSDIYYFEVGMLLRASATDGTSGALRTGELTITAVNENLGRFTATGEVTGLTANDSFFASGDFGLGSYGLASWCPATDPSGGENFFGVDRSVQRARLAGVYIDAATNGWGPEQAFIMANARSRRGYAKPKFWVVSPTDFANIEVTLNGKRRIVDDNDYSIGYEAIDAYGTTLMQDPNCQVGVAWGIADGAFQFYSLGDCPRMVDDDGLEIVRSGTAAAVTDADFSYEFRCVCRYNFGSPMPFGLTQMTLST